MKCNVCKRKKCVWIELKSDTSKIKTEKLKQVLNHNISYIEMLARQNAISAYSEERYYAILNQYQKELDKREF